MFLLLAARSIANWNRHGRKGEWTLLLWLLKHRWSTGLCQLQVYSSAPVHRAGSGSLCSIVGPFLYLFLSLAALGLQGCTPASSSCREQGRLFTVGCGFLILVSSLVGEPRLQCVGFSSGAAQAESLAVGGLLQDQDQAQAACIGRWILNHCTTREVPVVGPCNEFDSIMS